MRSRDRGRGPASDRDVLPGQLAVDQGAAGVPRGRHPRAGPGRPVDRLPQLHRRPAGRRRHRRAAAGARPAARAGAGGAPRPATPRSPGGSSLEHRIGMEARLAATERIVAELQSGLAPRRPTRRCTSAPSRRPTPCGSSADVPDADLWAFLERGLRPPARPCSTPSAPRRAGRPARSTRRRSPRRAPSTSRPSCPVAAPAGRCRRGGGRRSAVGLGEVPAGAVAVLVHAGGYDTIGDTYRTLGAWVARHARHAGDRVRERYVVGPADAASPEAYRTEIAWPILPG